MSTRYDPTDDTMPPKQPLEPVSKRGKWGTVTAIVLGAAVLVAAAFDFDLCAFLAGVGVTLESCPK